MSDLTSEIELLDSEVLQVEGVLKALQEKQRKRVPLEDFRKEAIERFAGIGLKLEVKVFETNQEGVFAFDFIIVDRMEPVEFDRERQAHEVVNDLLGIEPSRKGEVIKPTSTSGLIIPGHNHGH